MLLFKGYDDVAKLGGGLGTTAEEITQLGQPSRTYPPVLYEIFHKKCR
jgi:hypothetical protein